MNPWLLLLYITSAAVVVFGGMVGAVCLLGGRGEVAEHPDRPDELTAPGMRVYIPDVNRSLIPYERDCQDLPSYERLAELYLIPEETR